MATPAAVRWLVTLTVLEHMTFAGSRVAISLTALEMQASPFAIGLLLSFYGLLPTALSVAGGRWVDRVGMLRPMLIGTALVAAGVVAPLLIWDIASLFLATVTIGLGFMAFNLAIQKAIGVVGGLHARTASFSLLALGFSVSGFLGPAVAGVAIDTLGHRASFGVLALPTLLVLATLMLLPFRDQLRETSAPPARAPDERPARLRDLLATPELKRLYVSVTLLSSAWDVHQFLVPLYGAGIGLTASAIGFVLGAFSVATFVVRLLLPLITRHVAEWPLIIGAMASATLVYAVYPMFPSLTAMLVLSFALGIGLGSAQPMMMVVLYRESPPHRIGEAAGLRMTLINGTQTFLPTTFGAFGGFLGLSPMFWGMAMLIGTGAVYVGNGVRRGRAQR